MPHLPPHTWDGCLSHMSLPWSPCQQLSFSPSLFLPGALRSAAHAMLILHSMGITGTNFGLLKAAQKLLFCPTALLCFFPTGASVRRPSPPLLPASFSLAAPLHSLRPYPEFTTELEHVDNCVGRRTELLAFSAAINLAPV